MKTIYKNTENDLTVKAISIAYGNGSYRITSILFLVFYGDLVIELHSNDFANWVGRLEFQNTDCYGYWVLSKLTCPVWDAMMAAIDKHLQNA